MLGVSLASAATPAPSLSKSGAVYRLEGPRDVYQFDAVRRIESLREKGGAEASPAPVAAADPARLARRRAEFLRRLGRESLREVPEEGVTELRALRAIGYL